MKPSHTHTHMAPLMQTIKRSYQDSSGAHHPVIGAFCATKQLRRWRRADRIGPENRGYSRATATSKTARYRDPSSIADGSVCSHTQTENYKPETRDANRCSASKRTLSLQQKGYSKISVCYEAKRICLGVGGGTAHHASANTAPRPLQIMGDPDLLSRLFDF
jgi:hypothetical protein